MTLIEVHEAGALHKNQVDRNMRVLSGRSSPPALLIFDFRRAQLAKECGMPRRSCGSDHTIRRTIDFVRMDRYRMQTMLHDCGKAVEESGWFATGGGKRFLRFWRTYPEDLTEEQRKPAWYQPEMDLVKAKL